MINQNDVLNFLSFYKVPKALFSDEKYKKLTANAKLMYMLLFDRLDLSIKNGWKDDNGNVYQYYTIEQFMIDLNCSDRTVTKTKSELSKFGLLKEVRQGVNKPNRLYVIGIVNSSSRNRKNYDSRIEENTTLDTKKLRGIKTDINKTDINKTNIDNISSSSNTKIIEEIINYLNQRTMSNYRSNSKATQKHILARLKEGYQLSDFKYVIDVKIDHWMNDKKMRDFLRPSTLFGTKFEDYRNQKMKYSKVISDPNAAKFEGMENWNNE